MILTIQDITLKDKIQPTDRTIIIKDIRSIIISNEFYDKDK